MNIITKPNAKSATNAAVMTVGFVAGAKLGDGIKAAMPESVAPYSRYALIAVAILAAASVKTTTTAGVAAQSALLGMGAKQAYDQVTEMMTDAVPAEDDTTTKGKFMNALIGHAPQEALGYYDWTAADDIEWDRTADQMNSGNRVLGV